jgi:Phage head-tail joining protein
LADIKSIGEMRWPVILVTRSQRAQAGGTGIDEPWIDLMHIRAAIKALHPLTYWSALAAMQTDTPITHLIRIRWLDALDNTQAIKRVTSLKNRQTRTEIFRVRRFMEEDGRKRYAIIEAQQEQQLTSP